ncbi:MAG: hypothetical protein IJX76_06685 [Clostridia bacterium]|nr:hypothetical protein [Clostridia bacterium]
MELCFTETRKILRRGRASLAFRVRTPKTAGEGIAWIEYYTRAASALERWAADTLLARMEQAIEQAPRRGRLYTVSPQLSFLCDGSVTDGRWISLTSTVMLEQDGKITRREDHRVWDAQAGTLCPIEWFLPRKEAKRYYRWAFEIREGFVWGIPAVRSVKKGSPAPVRVGKLKYLFPPS